MILRFLQTLIFVSIASSGFTQDVAFYVKMKNAGEVTSAMQNLRSRFHDAEVTQPFASIPFENLDRVVRIDGQNLVVDDIKAALTFPVEYIENVPMAKLSYTPNDLGVTLGSPNQWYLHQVGAQEAWDYFKGSPDVTIAVVDNAFLPDHPDLVNKLRINTGEVPADGIDNDGNGYKDDYAGWDARNNNGDVFIQSFNEPHGTHVAGIAAAETDNGIGGSALSFRTMWLPVKASNNSDVITHGYEGITFAVKRGAKVVNCSWGTFDSSATAFSVINFAVSQHCFVVASAGNFADDTRVYPASYSGVVSVTATTQTDTKLSTSSYNRFVKISAPGSGIWSTISNPQGGPAYGFMSGTSMASPVVAALLGLMSGYAPAGNDSVILDCLYNTAKNIYGIPANAPYDSLMGKGRVQADEAMRCLFETLNLGTAEVENLSDWTVYPNPSSQNFVIRPAIDNNDAGDIFWTLRDLNGKEILSGKTLDGDISALPAGMYFLMVEHKPDGRRSTVKLVKP